MASDWLNIEMHRPRAKHRVIKLGSVSELKARLSEPQSGRCPHGFADGSGLCQVRGCSAFGKPSLVHTCVSCRQPYTASRAGRGLCPTCAAQRKGER